MAKHAKPVLTITYDGIKWSFKSVTPLKTFHIEFIDGVEFEEGYF